MSYGYNLDLQKCVLSYIEDGHTQKEASEVFKVPRQTIYNWLCLKKETGTLNMRRSGKRCSSKFDAEKLKEITALRSDYYLAELATIFNATPSSVYRALKRYSITRKKRFSSSKKEMRPSVMNS